MLNQNWDNFCVVNDYIQFWKTSVIAKSWFFTQSHTQCDPHGQRQIMGSLITSPAIALRGKAHSFPLTIFQSWSYKEGREREGEKERELSPWVHFPDSCKNQGWATAWLFSFTQFSQSQSLLSLSPDFPSASAGGWILSGAARTWISARKRCQPCMQLLTWLASFSCLVEVQQTEFA